LNSYLNCCYFLRSYNKLGFHKIIISSNSASLFFIFLNLWELNYIFGKFAARHKSTRSSPIYRKPTRLIRSPDRIVVFYGLRPLLYEQTKQPLVQVLVYSWKLLTRLECIIFGSPTRTISCFYLISIERGFLVRVGDPKIIHSSLVFCSCAAKI